ncbi:hypothetical protein CYMTET_24966 [Cymbomonas tetramitiformis]|uniref:Tubulin--tyrosine ligase-like protein 5 n=1 Tax=Cymbomonas tetramitiformis TaxID=36881 RepID=A0AAE0FV08_9CHLO|nr:hypothetical protein CYMTET_24966 [Cymbomonas tetramitiformis]
MTMSDEITAIDGSRPDNKAYITLDETVQDLESFKALCAPALGFVPELVVDRKGIRITDARQLWRRSECVLLRKTDAHLRPGTSPRALPHIWSHGALFGVALVGLLMAVLVAMGTTSSSHQRAVSGPSENILPPTTCGEGRTPYAPHPMPSSPSKTLEGEKGIVEDETSMPPAAAPPGKREGGERFNPALSTPSSRDLPATDAAVSAVLEQATPHTLPPGGADAAPPTNMRAHEVEPSETSAGAAPIKVLPGEEPKEWGGMGGKAEASMETAPGGQGNRSNSTSSMGSVTVGEAAASRSMVKNKGSSAPEIEETHRGSAQKPHREKGQDSTQVSRAGRVRVLVEHRRHEWPSDSLFSWAVLGTAMRRLGLRETRPEDLQWDLLFCMTEECSGVPSSVWRWPAGFTTLRQGQWTNHVPGISELSGRDRLYRNLRVMAERHGPHFQVMPETYLLPEEAPALQAAASLVRAPTTRHAPANEGASNLWLLKNLTVADGQQVMFGQDKVMVQGNTQAPWPEQVKEPFLAQRYVSDPYLLHGRKFTIRLYLLITSVHPLRLYVHEEGLVHLAVEKYSTANSALGDPYVHLTNEALAARHDEVQPPSSARQGGKTNKARATGVGGAGRKAAAEARQHKCVLTLRELRSMLLKAGRPVESLWRELESTAVKALLSAEDRLVMHSKRLLQAGGRAFELLGMDVVIDKQMRPWLLDLTDAVPSLQAETNVKYAMKERVVTDMLRLVGAAPTEAPSEVSVKDAVDQKVTEMVRRWGDLDEGHLEVVHEVEEEFQRRSGFGLIFPSIRQTAGAPGEDWLRYFADPQPLNILLQRWGLVTAEIQEAGGHRDNEVGI